MDGEQLKNLLSLEESATLEFKSEPYWIDHEQEKAKSRQRDELIKDILALANGNSIVAGERAYLIIGADNKKRLDGVRLTYDIGENALSVRRILDIVNSACSPKLEDLDSDVVALDGKQLNVITIHPSPYLFETIRKLEPSTTKGAYTEYVVFVRHNESVKVASGKERDAIAKLKKLRFNEARNPSPAPFGAAIGATVGAFSLGAAAEKILGKKEGAQAAGTLAGVLVGGVMGGLFGYIYRDIRDIQNSWYRIIAERKFIVLLFLSIYSLFVWVIFHFLPKKKKT